MGERGRRRFPRITLAAVARQEGETEIYVFQRVALDEAAHAERQAALLGRDAPEAEAVLGLHGAGPVRDVAARRVQVADAAVADEAQPVRLVHELQDEGCIFRYELAQP